MLKIFQSENKITELLEWLAILSIVGMIILRIYAGLVTEPVLTYDDKHYRGMAMYFEYRLTTEEAVRSFFLPNPRKLGTRSMGYNSCLILFHKMLSKLGVYSERIWQIANMSLFFLQLVFVYLIFNWASKQRWLVFSAVFFYASMPIMFGISRWVLTENFVLPSLLIYPAIAIFIVTVRSESKKIFSVDYIMKEILLPGLAAYIFGVFTTTREFVWPYILVLFAAICFALVLQKRLPALGIFAAISWPYMYTNLELGGAFKRYMYKNLYKTGLDRSSDNIQIAMYYMTLTAWIKKAFFNSIGPAASFIILTWVVVLVQRSMQIISGLKKTGLSLLEILKQKMKLIYIFFFIQLGITGGYWLMVCIAKVRMLRMAVPPLGTLVVSIAMSLKLMGIISKNRLFLVKKVFLILILLSWGVMIYQLTVPFDGGKSFSVRPDYLPTYNHPLHLRKLTFVGDWHVIDIPYSEKLRDRYVSLDKR